MGPSSPAISVILTCRDLADHVTDAIRSVQAQSFTDFEAIVVDDGSADDSRAVIRSAICGDERFRVICQPPSGLSAARNLGLDQARGRLIAFLDGDDSYAPEFLAEHCRELTASGAAWTASALTLFWPDGRTEAHSAIHGHPLQTGAAHWCHLTDARDIARHFPSAWNKLYRRDLIGDTRFIEGAVYEDHPFFWTLACKAGRLRRLPQPLYRYRRGRPGQITDCADDVILQQIARLQEVAQIARAHPLHHVDQGLSQLATRLIHERLTPPIEPGLRAQFLDRAADFFAQQGLRWDRAGAIDIAPAPAPQLDPELRLTVLICPGSEAACATTRLALARQSLPIRDIWLSDTIHPVAALMTHLQDLDTAWCVCLQAGDQPGPDWAVTCIEQARATGAVCVIAGATFAAAPHRANIDPGMAEPATALAAPDPSALMLHKTALASLPDRFHDRLGVAPGPLAALCLAAHFRESLTAVRIGALQLGPRARSDLMALAASLRAVTPDLCPLSLSERANAFAHLAQMQRARLPGRAARLWQALYAGLARRRAGLPPPDPLPQLGPVMRACLGVARTARPGA